LVIIEPEEVAGFPLFTQNGYVHKVDVYCGAQFIRGDRRRNLNWFAGSGFDAERDRLPSIARMFA
jgi:hypothetical protein